MITFSHIASIRRKGSDWYFKAYTSANLKFQNLSWSWFSTIEQIQQVATEQVQ